MKPQPFLTAALFLIGCGWLAIALAGCDGNHIIGEEYGDLECRTISVDQCFAVQCGYGLLPHLTAASEIVAHALFFPADYFYRDAPVDHRVR